MPGEEQTASGKLCDQLVPMALVSAARACCQLGYGPRCIPRAACQKEPAGGCGGLHKTDPSIMATAPSLRGHPPPVHGSPCACCLAFGPVKMDSERVAQHYHVLAATCFVCMCTTVPLPESHAHTATRCLCQHSSWFKTAAAGAQQHTMLVSAGHAHYQCNISIIASTQLLWGTLQEPVLTTQLGLARHKHQSCTTTKYQYAMFWRLRPTLNCADSAHTAPLQCAPAAGSA